MRQFLEWPELAAPRLTPGPSTGADLARLLASVRDSGTVWEERRRAARETYQAFHRPEQSANVLLEFLEALE